MEISGIWGKRLGSFLGKSVQRMGEQQALLRRDSIKGKKEKSHKFGRNDYQSVVGHALQVISLLLWDLDPRILES